MKVNSIIIVGGGTAGCISALILNRRFPQCSINIIESEKIGIVGVGEGSTEQWKDFIKYCGFTDEEIIRECGATFKMGILYDKWDDKPFMHSILLDRYPGENYYYSYAHLISNNVSKKELQPNWVWDSNVPLQYYIPSRQYHFDTFKLNSFLHKKCIERGINFFVDDIGNVTLDDQGNIESLVGKSGYYKSDFYVDCSGFKRLLVQNTLGIKWKSYNEYLPLNSAIAFQTPESEKYNMWTKATAHNAGWGWTIPVQGKTGNGYVYSDNFISQSEAHKEMERYTRRRIKNVKHFKFDAGRLENFWYKNCVAIGLSSNFVEPLEATSIGTSIQQAYLLTQMLPSYDYQKYNSLMVDIFDGIIDFIVAHYLVRREDTPFWKEVKYNLKIPDSLKNLLSMWKNRLPQGSDLTNPYKVISAINYIPILYGLNWFDIKAISKEYEMYPRHDLVDIDLMEKKCYDKNSPKIEHKKLIQGICETHVT
tara:strand:- start:1415 stop:2851 length:1437 start_codon:yes stop_codon:yes gene_type:complete